MPVLAPPYTRLLNAIAGVVKLYKTHPHYLILGAVIGFFMGGFVVWALNIELISYVITEIDLPAIEKLRFFWDIQTGIYRAFDTMQFLGIIVFGQLFGINVMLGLYAIKNKALSTIPRKSGVFGLMFAFLSGGCIACGTSLLAPLLITLGVTSTSFMIVLSGYLSWISAILMLYSIYRLADHINTTQT